MTVMMWPIGLRRSREMSNNRHLRKKKGSPQGDQFISTTEGGTSDESLHFCICTGRVTIDSHLPGRVWEALWNVGTLQLQYTTLNALSAAQRALNHGSSNLSSNCEQNACELADPWPIFTGKHPPETVQSRDGEERTPSRDHPMGPSEWCRLPRCPAPGTGEYWSFSSLSPFRRHSPNRHRSAPLPTSHLIGENPCRVSGTRAVVAPFWRESICHIGQTPYGTTRVMSSVLTHSLYRNVPRHGPTLSNACHLLTFTQGH